MTYHYFIKVTGKDQGDFHSDSAHAGAGRSLCHQLRFKGTSDNAPHRGKEGASRTHLPLLVVKPWGPSSPNFAAAFWNREELSTVELSFPRSDGSNPEALFHQIILTNAVIASYEIRAGDKTDVPEGAPPELEYIELRFEQMEIKNLHGKTSAKFHFKNH